MGSDRIGLARRQGREGRRHLGRRPVHHDYGSLGAKDLLNDEGAGKNVARVVIDKTRIGLGKRLALGAIDNKCVYLLVCGREELDVSRNSVAIRFDHAACQNFLHDLLGCGFFPCRFHAGHIDGQILPVVFNFHGENMFAPRVRESRHGQDHAGNRRMDGRGSGPRRLRHHLSEPNLVAALDKHGRSLARVLEDGEDNDCGRRHCFEGRINRGFSSPGRVNSTAKAERKEQYIFPFKWRLPGGKFCEIKVRQVRCEVKLKSLRGRAADPSQPTVFFVACQKASSDEKRGITLPISRT